jgi:hypothetical protein
MSFPARRALATHHPRNVHTLPGIAALAKTWRIHYPLAFSRAGNPHWICESSAVSTGSTVEVYYEWEVRDGRYTKYRMRQRVDGVETEKRGFSSKSGRERTTDSEKEPDIDWITMRRKQQKKHEAPMVKADEAGFEKGVERKIENQLDDAFVMPPRLKKDGKDAFEMPQPREPEKVVESKPFEMPPPQEEKEADAKIFQMPPPPKTKPTASPVDISKPEQKPQAPSGSNKRDTIVVKNTSRVLPIPGIAKAKPKNDAPAKSSAPPYPPPSAPGPAPRPVRLTSVPHPDVGLPRTRKSQTDPSLPGPKAPPSPEGAAWTWEPVGDPMGTKAVDAAWEGATNHAIRHAEAVRSSSTPNPPLLETTQGDENIDSLLPSQIRASMSRHTPSTYPTSSSSSAHEELEKDSWHETFGVPEEPGAAYTTITLSPFTFTASSSTPLPLLRAHATSFLLHTPTSAATISSQHVEDEWNGFDPTPAIDAENSFVFLLYPDGARQPYFALTTMPTDIATPTAELKPTEALDFLRHSGTFLPYLRAGRSQGGRLLHATREGVTWGVMDKGEGWRVIRALERIAREGERGTLEFCEFGRAITPEDLGKVRPVVGRKRGRVARRMFWAGMWVGGLTGAMGAFGNV